VNLSRFRPERPASAERQLYIWTSPKAPGIPAGPELRAIPSICTSIRPSPNEFHDFRSHPTIAFRRRRPEIRVDMQRISRYTCPFPPVLNLMESPSRNLAVVDGLPDNLRYPSAPETPAPRRLPPTGRTADTPAGAAVGSQTSDWFRHRWSTCCARVPRLYRRISPSVYSRPESTTSPSAERQPNQGIAVGMPRLVPGPPAVDDQPVPRSRRHDMVARLERTSTRRR
jgi:hypothetical protein